MNTAAVKTKSIRIRLKDSEGKVYVWSIRRVARAFLVNPEGPLSPSRYGSGWEYEDHDGYVRFQEGTWLDLLPRIRLTIENYGLTLCSELS